MKRRKFLKDSGLILLSSAVLPSMPKWMSAEKILVVIFQRGGADGISMVPPVGDPGYGKKIRPSTALSPGECLPLTGFFGLHPAFSDIMPLWNERRCAVIHQVGSLVHSRSHFDAQDFMETAGLKNNSTESGFLARLIEKLPENRNSIFTGLALQPNLPRALHGIPGTLSMNSLDECSDTALKNLSAGPTKVNYPAGRLGKHLEDIARLIRGKTGVRVAVTDCGGWDTHEDQGAVRGQMADRLSELGGSIAAFTKDLGPLMKDVCLVTMTEFGRSVHENAKGGTDHGHGSVMFVIGDSVRGGDVRGQWKNLRPDNLSDGGGMPVTTDFREVWTDIFENHMKISDAKTIFPGFAPSVKNLGLFA